MWNDMMHALSIWYWDLCIPMSLFVSCLKTLWGCPKSATTWQHLTIVLTDNSLTSGYAALFWKRISFCSVLWLFFSWWCDITSFINGLTELFEFKEIWMRTKPQHLAALGSAYFEGCCQISSSGTLGHFIATWEHLSSALLYFFFGNFGQFA